MWMRKNGIIVGSLCWIKRLNNWHKMDSKEREWTRDKKRIRGYEELHVNIIWDIMWGWMDHMTSLSVKLERLFPRSLELIYATIKI